MVKVLIVEDSSVIREFLLYVLSSDPDIHVIGTATSGEEALEILKHKQPDVITMDIHMPGMNGFEATRRIMETHPTPIVIVSGSWSADEVATTFRAVEAGALAVLPRPNGIGHPEHRATSGQLIQTVKLMSEVKVIRRWPRNRGSVAPLLPEPIAWAPSKVKIVAVGASTGGPIVLQTILSRLPKDFPVPVLIVQHIAAGFSQGFIDWLTQSSGIPVRLCTHQESLIAGHAYVAPDGLHMGVTGGGQVVLSGDDPEHGLRPSVSYLFRSVARFFGSSAVGVLLTGMGKDGALELKMMRDKGAITFAQDEESSVVFGMPGEAVRLDAACYVLTPERIAVALGNVVKNGANQGGR